MSVIGQPSLFGVAALAPHALDLAGLLLAGGATARWPDDKKTDDTKTDDTKTDDTKIDDKKTVKPKTSAQVSVLVDHPWRASVLVLECARRGVAATCVAGVEQRICVRTAHSPLLVALVDVWTDGPMACVPGELVLDGQPLRLWVEAAGRYERPGTYRLDCGLAGEADRQRVAAALADDVELERLRVLNRASGRDRPSQCCKAIDGQAASVRLPSAQVYSMRMVHRSIMRLPTTGAASPGSAADTPGGGRRPPG